MKWLKYRLSFKIGTVLLYDEREENSQNELGLNAEESLWLLNGIT